MIEKIQQVIDSEINPNLASHGGGCEIVDLKDGTLTIRLLGGCSGCPSRQGTLLNGIEPVLKEKVPNLQNVVLG